MLSMFTMQLYTEIYRKFEMPDSMAKEQKMKQFAIKGYDTTPSVMELLEEIENGFIVRIIRTRDDWEDVSEEFISKDLFETCLRTGYIAEMSA